MTTIKLIQWRARQYIALGILLLGTSLVAPSLDWQGGPHLHTVMETVATVLALMVGTMSLIRYFTQAEAKFLYLGAGFIGTAVLDGFHAIVTAPQVQPLMPSDYANLVPWSWIASRLFLSAMMFFSWWMWFRSRHQPQVQIHPARVYWGTALATLASLLFFTSVPLPSMSYAEWPVHRPADLLPGLLFLVSLGGYLYKGDWRRESFEHWLVLSLVVGVATQLGFMPYSAHVNDTEFNIAHLLKKASYIFVLSGLLVSLYQAYTRLKEETAARMRLEGELREEAKKLQESRAWFKNIVDYTCEWETWYSPDSRLLYVSPSCERVTGYSAAAFLAGEVDMPRLISTKEPAEIREHFLRISDDHPRREMDFRIVTKSGEERWISHACQAIYDENGMFIGRRGSNRDVTERKHAELTSQAMLEALHGSPVTVVITDSKGNIEYANPMFEESSGYAVADVIGKNPRILKSGHHPEEFYARMWATLNSGASWTGEFLNKRRDGELYWEHASIIPVRDESGATVKFVAIKQDITAQKTKEASLYRQASFDALTGLPNRTLFGDRLQHALKKLVRHHEPFALMMIDLDYFKQVNDTFGHAAGDDLLKQATQRMMACLRDSDTLARIGGDEFIVLIDSLVDSNAPDAVASRLNTELARPFTIFGHEVRISGSIGIAIASQPGLTEETLIKQADIALYQAKTQGRNRTMAYQTDQSPELTNPAP